MDDENHHEDTETLIQPASLEDSDESELYFPQKFLCSRWKLFSLCILIVLVTSVLVITLPMYTEAVNIEGDVYSALLFVSLFVFLPSLFAVQVQHKYLCRINWFGISPGGSIKCGILHGLSILMIAFSLDRKRVYCHIQEPMMMLVVLFMIVIYFFYGGPGLMSTEMLCLCGVLIGLFFAMDFQINNIYHCHGHIRMQPEDDGGIWNVEEHSFWILICFIGFFIYTLAWLLLEKDLCSKKIAADSDMNTISEVVTHSGSAGLTNHADLLIVHPSSIKWNIQITWFLAASFITVLALFWTDAYTSFGKADSAASFSNITMNGLFCHFVWQDRCGPTLLYGWLFVVSLVAFFYLVGLIIEAFGSIIFAFAVASIALPLSSVWWNIFELEGFWKISFSPKISGECIFSVIGLPVMVSCVLYWAYFNRKCKHNRNSVIMS